jgi:hypothetical protein
MMDDIPVESVVVKDDVAVFGQHLFPPDAAESRERYLSIKLPAQRHRRAVHCRK